MKKLFSLLALSLLSKNLYAGAPRGSLAKIDAALGRTEISAAEAQGLKVLAFFQDPSLPSQFHPDSGADPEEYSDYLLPRAIKALPEMGEDLAGKVYRYMIPAPYRPKPSSLKSLSLNGPIPKPEPIPAEDWAYLDSITANVRIWYEKNNEEQFQIAAKLRAHLIDEIIPAAKRLTGKTHLSDGLINSSITVRVGLELPQPNGGDGKLDVYLFDLPRPKPPRAYVQIYGFDEQPAGVGCPSWPSYMAVNASWVKLATTAALRSTLAHEYFHVLQNTYQRKEACASYDKMDEGVATWFEDYAYSKDDEEHAWYKFFEHGEKSLLNESYGTWTFYYYLAQMQGTASIPALYGAHANLGPMEALDSVLKGGFKKNWIDYAVYEWNQNPLQDSFLQWDRFANIPLRDGTAIEIEKVTLNSKGQYSMMMRYDLKPLTRDFYAFDLSDPSIRSVSIDNPIILQAKKAKGKLLVRKKGHSDFDEILLEDPKRHVYEYCLDNRDEQIDLLVIVVGNFNHKETAPVFMNESRFKATNQGCHKIGGGLKQTLRLKNDSTQMLVELVASDLMFKAKSRSSEGNFGSHFVLTKGSVSYTYKGTVSGCSGEASGNVLVDETSVGIGHYPYNVAPDTWGSYFVRVPLQQESVMVTHMCPSPKPPMQVPVPLFLSTINAQKTNGSDHWKGSDSNETMHVEWDVSPIRDE